MNATMNAVVLWFATAPHMGATGYRGIHGWHQTITYKDRAVHTERETVSEALQVCASHKWKGYIRWYSAIGIETDSCEFMRLVLRHESGEGESHGD